MNNLEFRVWSLKDKRFLSVGNVWFVSKHKYGYDTDQDTYTPEEIVIQQYIGLKDKNGNKIYVGDLIKFKVLNNKGDFKYSKEYQYCVVWHENEAAFVVADSGDGAYFNRFSDMTNIKVIGNIFENE